MKIQLKPLLVSLVAGLLSSLLLRETAEAIEVENLYQGRVIVASRSDEAERAAAFGEALQEVLIKVSGQRTLLQQSRIAAALNRPQAFVDSWSYNSREGLEGESLIELRVSFVQESVQRLLADNDIALWPSNRPLTLVWLVAEDDNGHHQIISQSDSHPLLGAVREEMRQRGMPILLPLMDLDDIRAVNVDSLWELDREHIQMVSLRYSVDSILVLRVFTSLGNEYLGRSKYFFRSLALEQELYATSLEELVQPAVDQAADELAGYYAISLRGGESGVSIALQVDGVANLEDYASLLQYVESMTDVSAYSITRVTGDRVELELSTGGQTRQLVESIALGRRLVSVSDPIRQGESLFMHYRWAE